MRGSLANYRLGTAVTAASAALGALKFGLLR
jgi:hypothetical protein